MEHANRIGRLGQDRSTWLILLLVLLGVLVPAACVLWFMNEAASSQAESARQAVMEAYRGQLRLVRDRVDFFWRNRTAALQKSSGEWTAAVFPRILAAGAADSAILLDSTGAVRYPSPLVAPPADPALFRAGWQEAVILERRREGPAEAAAAYQKLADSEPDPGLAARAAQAQIRCLVQNGAKEAALAALQHRFNGTGSRPAPGLDAHDRLIAADEQLLALGLLSRGDSRYGATARRLAAWLNDYGISMPSAQRLFLMDELRALAPDIAAFPTYEAEQLAARFLESGTMRLGGSALERAGVPGLWKLASTDGRVVALYRTGSVLSATSSLFDEQNRPATVKFALNAPGATNAGEAISAGAILPGWQISFSVLNTQPFDEAARSRRVAYLWAGYLAVALIIATGLVIGQSFRRQWRLARLKSDSVATVSHELKTPLASMRLLVDSLLEQTEPDPGKTREYLELIAGENVRLTRLIGNFLTFSRMERNRQRFDFADTQPSDVIQSALVAMRERLQSPGCRLDVDVSPDLPALHADSDALTTVLLNLLDNACKYTPDDKRISLRAYTANGHVVFAVKDNGIGITSRDRKRIFRRFYQVDRRLSRETGGCGLGLSIVEFIVRAHGGTVSVESQPGAGSTFSVRLPSREATA